MGFINRLFGKPELKYYVAKFEEDHIRDEDLYDLVKMSKESIKNIKELYSQILKSEEKLLIEYRNDEKLIIELFKKLALKKENSNLLMSEINKLEKNSRTCSFNLKESLDIFFGMFKGTHCNLINGEELDPWKNIRTRETKSEINNLITNIEKIKKEFDKFNLKNNFGLIEKDLALVNSYFISNLTALKEKYFKNNRAENLKPRFDKIRKTYKTEIIDNNLSVYFNKIDGCLRIPFYNGPFYDFANKRVHNLISEKNKLITFLIALKERINEVLVKAESEEKKYEQKQMAFNHN